MSFLAPSRILARRALPAIAMVLALVAAQSALAQELTTPEAFFGHRVGADYELPDYGDLTRYWETLAAESPRMTLQSIGKTAESRDQLMAIVTSPENHANLDEYREISARLARANGVSEDEARDLAKRGKAVVWIDGGLHATEVLGAQQLMETLWQFVSGTDDETMRILDDVIILFVHANPDGMDLVSNWYTRIEEKTERSTRGIPVLYQKYVGHDNNRDFYASFQPESENMNRQMYRTWYPQIVYNHHQTGPTGTVLFAPPFRDPFNYNIDPMVITGIDLVGAAMHSRFTAEDKPGATRRRGANYSTWWNGGLRTMPYFHNMIGLLTETIGNPTPMEIPLILERVLPNDNLPAPIAPQPWHFRQSIDYSVTANKAVLDLASRYRETFLYRIWRMGMNSIDRGSKDSWTIQPKRVDWLRNEMRAGQGETDFARNVGGFGGSRGTRADYDKLFNPDLRDPRGYILPSDQADFPTATKFVNSLLETGVMVERATSDFSVGGTHYPAGSYVVRAAQAFRPHLLDMFEPQDHPNDFLYPGAPPTPPYDNAGWSLAIQMGVDFDRILEGFDGPFEEIEEWNASPMPGVVADAAGAAGFLFSHEVNDAFTAINRLQASGHEVYWLTSAFTEGGRTHPAGTFYVKSRGGTADQVASIAGELGLNFRGLTEDPDADALRLREPQIALWDTYGGSMPSGWIRWILEQYGFADYELVFPQRLNAGNLSDDFDVIIFPQGAIGSQFEEVFAGVPDSVRQEMMRQFGFGAPDPETIPAEYRDRLGRVSPGATMPALVKFLEDGGSIVTIGGSTDLGKALGLPLEDHLVNGGQPLSREEYYVPGSILEVSLDNSRLVATGVPSPLAVSFNNSPVFSPSALDSGAAAAMGVTPLAWFDSDAPLISGWAWGQEYLQGGVTMAEAEVGDGHLYLFGPLITRRAQPHGTFKLLFNAIALSNAEPDRP
ncbi:M14 family metallopeptidase [Candidatus Palauibacter sp.]|uniref:M14 family metallopeptidase n=1 Tax=Candidatus Palauibacter sp. TaxID=3101350 RepID=UPI003AF1EB8F